MATPRFLRETPPLVGTLGRCEIEVAAALVLFALHELGRDWSEPVTAREVGQQLRAALEAKREPLISWSRNPFLQIDFDGLFDRGFAIRGANPTGGDTLTLTPKALERLAMHIGGE